MHKLKIWTIITALQRDFKSLWHPLNGRWQLLFIDFFVQKYFDLSKHFTKKLFQVMISRVSWQCLNCLLPNQIAYRLTARIVGLRVQPFDLVLLFGLPKRNCFPVFLQASNSMMVLSFLWSLDSSNQNLDTKFLLRIPGDFWTNFIEESANLWISYIRNVLLFRDHYFEYFGYRSHNGHASLAPIILWIIFN